MKNVQRVQSIFFSPTSTTKKIVSAIAKELARKLRVAYVSYDFTLPNARKEPLQFAQTDLIIFGIPVYAGRVPNILLPFLDTIQGNEALAIPVVLYGNRDYDDALIELRDILEKNGSHTIAAAAFIGEHSFSKILAKDRPDKHDMIHVDQFVESIIRKYQTTETNTSSPIPVKGIPYPYRGYYTPRDRKGIPVDIRKVKPLTNEKCNECELCAKVCPMGSIDPEHVREFTGICIKCGACIKKCPKQAKSYEDAGYLYHQHELEEGLTRRAEPEFFV